MKAIRSLLTLVAVTVFVLIISVSCTRKAQQSVADHPRLTPNVTMRDVTFRSAALDRDMQYRVILPVTIPAGKKMPVVYLLHGGDSGFRDWSNYSDVARFAERGLILIMPQGDDSYYTNAADRPEDRYEDYIVSDLIGDVEQRFPASVGRANRAIVGVSMGGFGAVKLALKHPDLFAFSAGLSSAVDVPTRPYSILRTRQWRRHRSIFGPWGSQGQKENDPFSLARSVDPARVPYLYLTCGDREGLLPANRRLAAILDARNFQYEFHVVRGGHDWAHWNQQLEDCFRRLLQHVSS